MTSLTHHYEILLILNVSKSEEERTALIEKFKTLIAKEGEIEKVELWGKRRLAYPINFQNEGFYVLFYFTAPPSLPRELDRVFGITDGILRSLIIRRDERYLDVEVKLDRSESSPRRNMKQENTETAPVAQAASVEPAGEEAPAPTEEAGSSAEASAVEPTPEGPIPAEETAPTEDAPNTEPVVDENPINEEAALDAE